MLLDEIQIVDDWEASVNSFLVDFDTDIYVTGSNSNMLFSELSTLLTGRYVQIRMQPLESTFLINRVNRFDLHGKEILKTQEKFYLADQGILHSVLGYHDRNILELLENIVYNELVYRGYSVHIGKIKDREIDFVATKWNKRVYLQVTYKMESENTINREFGPLLSVDDHYPKYVLSMDEHFNDNIEGVQHMKLIHFLTSNHWEK